MAKRFCDVNGFDGEAQAFLPPSTRPLPVAGAGTKQPVDAPYRWVNLWATWCVPCMEEIPLLEGWQRTLKKDGHALALEMISVDEDEEALKASLEKKAPDAALAWVADKEALAPFLKSLGVGEDSPIPVHVLVDREEKIRCVRVGKVTERDFATVKQLVAQ